MSFIWPVMLVLVLVIPAFVYLYVRLLRRRRQLVRTFGSATAQPGVPRPVTQINWGRHVPFVLFLAALLILIVALARPQAVLSLPRVNGTIILAFDVSGSMAANDFKPTRMDAAKAAVQDFVKRQPPTVQIGVVAFSDSGFAAQSPTNDQSAILAAINRLTPTRGTSLAYGIQASLNTIAALNAEGPHQYSLLTPTPAPSPTPMPKGTYVPAAIVLLTDGENNESPDPLAAAQTAADRGVRIYTIGIGSPAGTIIHVNGFTLHTQLNEPLLRQISQMTDGAYYNAQTPEDLNQIYDNLNPRLVFTPQKTELTSLLAGLSIILMLIGGMISLLWFGRLP